MNLRHSGDLGEQEMQAIVVSAIVGSVLSPCFRREIMYRLKAEATLASQGSQAQTAKRVRSLIGHRVMI